MPKSAIFRSMLAVGAVLVGAAYAHTADAAPIVTGDVFAAIGNGQVQEYNSSLQLVTTLNTGTGGFTTGMAFDSNKNLYVTDFSANQISVFGQSNSALSGTYGSGYATPESIVFNQAGDSFVSSVAGGATQEFNAAGTLIDSFSLGRTDWLDLASDQHTLLYTTEGGSVMSYNTATHTANANFATGLSDAYALRILANGDVLVADGSDVKLFDPSGTLIKTYGVTNIAGFFALNIDPNGNDFYSGSFDNGTFYKFDIATGNVLATVNTGCGGDCFYGLAVAGEITQGGGGGNVPEPASLALLGTALAGFGWVRRKRQA